MNELLEPFQALYEECAGAEMELMLDVTKHARLKPIVKPEYRLIVMRTDKSVYELVGEDVNMMAEMAFEDLQIAGWL